MRQLVLGVIIIIIIFAGEGVLQVSDVVTSLSVLSHLSFKKSDDKE